MTALSLHFRVHFSSDLEPPRSIPVIARDRAGARRLAELVLRRDVGAERAQWFHLDHIELRSSPAVDFRGAA